MRKNEIILSIITENTMNTTMNYYTTMNSYYFFHLCFIEHLSNTNQMLIEYSNDYGNPLNCL